jgi:hypothetical protein
MERISRILTSSVSRILTTMSSIDGVLLQPTMTTMAQTLKNFKIFVFINIQISL